MISWLPGLDPEPKIRRRLLLDQGEDRVAEVKHHWVAYVRPSLWAVLGVLLLVLVFFAPSISLLLLLGGAGVLAFAVYQMLLVRTDRFVVTNKRVFRVHGVFSEYAATMPLSRILDITVHKPPMGRLLGYADFTFETAAQEQGLRVITTVPHPDEVEKKIQAQVDKAGLFGPRVN